MDEKELMLLRARWYNSPFVLFQIAQNLRGRETSFLKGKTELPLLDKKAIPVRAIKAHSSDFLKKNFEAFSFYDKPYNIYQSVAGFQDMPMMSYAPAERKKQQTAFFNDGGFALCWVSYDFVLDLDADKIEDAYADAKKVKKVLDEFGLPYHLKFSGSRGFHFVISDDKIFPAGLKLNDKVLLSERIAKNIKELENIPSIDLVIYQPQRLFKVPYSLEGFNVALPLSNKEFEEWKLENMRVDKVLQNVQIKNRGLLERPLTKPAIEFIKMFGVS